MSEREEFVTLASSGGCVSRLCGRFGISRATGYVWLRRWRESGLCGLSDRPRRPLRSPGRTPASMERLIVELRGQHPMWGGRKLKARLEQLGYSGVPSASTVTAVLRRHGLISDEASESAKGWTRFERAEPNELWQMDFKGPIATHGGSCHALTVLDDHSRFSLGVRACVNQRSLTVRHQLESIFGRYGLPWRMLADNGPPWGGEGLEWTELTVWLLKLGVLVMHGRPYHPQTQGKDERFHRTLKAELLRRCDFKHVRHAQSMMDCWRDVYNLERPHEAIGLVPPATRYRPSPRAMPSRLPRYEPGPGQTGRVVKEGGHIRHGGRRWYLGQAWDREVVGLQPSAQACVTDVYFGPYLIAKLDAHPEAERAVRLVPVGRRAPDLHQTHQEA